MITDIASIRERADTERDCQDAGLEPYLVIAKRARGGVPWREAAEVADKAVADRATLLALLDEAAAALRDAVAAVGMGQQYALADIGEEDRMLSKAANRARAILAKLEGKP